MRNAEIAKTPQSLAVDAHRPDFRFPRQAHSRWHAPLPAAHLVNGGLCVIAEVGVALCGHLARHDAQQLLSNVHRQPVCDSLVRPAGLCSQACHLLAVRKSKRARESQNECRQGCSAAGCRKGSCCQSPGDSAQHVTPQHRSSVPRAFAATRLLKRHSPVKVLAPPCPPFCCSSCCLGAGHMHAWARHTSLSC